ncbi:MAG: hypothetical protein RIS64_1888, partial [Bacteroidota bacterium]
MVKKCFISQKMTIQRHLMLGTSKKNWKNVIKNFNLPWQQYLDLNGIEAKKLSIVAYPSNFLLDEQGK